MAIKQPLIGLIALTGTDYSRNLPLVKPKKLWGIMKSIQSNLVLTEGFECFPNLQQVCLIVRLRAPSNLNIGLLTQLFFKFDGVGVRSTLLACSARTHAIKSGTEPPRGVHLPPSVSTALPWGRLRGRDAIPQGIPPIRPLQAAAPIRRTRCVHDQERQLSLPLLDRRMRGQRRAPLVRLRVLHTARRQR